MIRNAYWGGALAFVLAGLAAAAPASRGKAPGYEQRLATANAFLKSGQFTKAVGEAQEAIRLNENAFGAYWVAGLALYKLDSLDLAQTYFRSALSHAGTGAERTEANDALRITADKKVYVDKVTTAEKAEREGFLGKAASEYTAAWELFPRRGDVGLRAAKLWSERLNDLPEAARILHRLAAQSDDARVAEEARQLLKKLSPQLEQMFTDQMHVAEQAISERKADKALDALKVAATVAPDRQEPQLDMARVHAATGATDAVLDDLRAAARLGAVDVAALNENGELLSLYSDEDFLDDVDDILGPAAADEMRRQAQEAASRSRALAAHAAQVAAQRANMRGFLGVQPQAITPEMVSELKLSSTNGALVAEVARDGPAARAGIKPGDVITALNGHSVRDGQQLLRDVASAHPGDTLPLELVRAGKPYAVNVQVAAQPSGSAPPRGRRYERNPQQGADALGIEVEELTPRLAQRHSYATGSGVVVAARTPNSRSSNAGINAGDLLMEANGQPLSSVADYREAVKRAKPGETILLRVRRGKSTAFVPVSVPK